MGYVDQLRHYDLDPEVRLIVDAQYAKGLVKIDPSAAMLSLRAVIADASTSGQHRVASWATTTLVNVLCTNGDLTEALELTKIRAEWDRGADIGPWSKAANEVQHLQVLG